LSRKEIIVLINLTADQGSSIWMLMENLKFPVSAAKQAKGFPWFAPQTAAGIDHKISLLRKQFNKVSPLVEKTGRILFGKIEAYEEKRPTPEALEKNPDAASTWKLKQDDMKTEVELDGDEARGLFWVLYLSLYPDEEKDHQGRSIERRFPISLQGDVSWPVLKQLGRVGEMRDKLGMDAKEFADAAGKSDKEIEEAAAIADRRAEEAEEKSKKEKAA